jgi:hypothetical protein
VGNLINSPLCLLLEVQTGGWTNFSFFLKRKSVELHAKLLCGDNSIAHEQRKFPFKKFGEICGGKKREGGFYFERL